VSWPNGGESKWTNICRHLSNEGVEETPPSHHSSTNGAHGVSTSPKDLFVDLSGCNVGFKNWHPTPVTDKGSKLCGQGDVGGLWEWTSTLLAPFDGYKPMDLYPGYSADFFDGKHNICVGGSWATVPRIAGRKSFVSYNLPLPTWTGIYWSPGQLVPA
jgi:L-histidine Nalpha-methyltransferase / hercynylcysteine S-oxide synthase